VAELTGVHENDSWRLYRIKLSDGVEVSSTGEPPLIEAVRHARIWFNDVNRVTGGRLIQLSEFKIVGNRWEDDGIRNLRDQIRSDTNAEFAIGVISNKSDPTGYDPPIMPNVENEVSEKEGSLFLRYDNLGDSTQVRIFKRFTGNGIDITQYREIGFWVHTEEWDDDLEYYFRLGSNENNYYEIAAPVTPQFFDAGGWMLASVKLEDLTNLKLAPEDTASAFSRDLKISRKYKIKLVGAPSLFSLRRLYAGIRNVGSDGRTYSGELWINDIYLDDVRRDIDYAQRVSGSVNFGGGVLTLSGGWTRTGPDFRGLRQRRGSGALNQSFNINAKTNLKFFVPLAGFSIPLSGNYRKSNSRPKFVPNSDTEISTDALKDSLETVRVSQGFSTALSKKNSKNPLLKYSIDKITTNFSYSRSRSRTPASTDTSTSMNGTLGYQINWTGDKKLKVYKGLGFRYWLNSLNVRTTATRQTSRRWRLIGDEFQPDPFVFNASLKNSGSMNYSPWKSVTSSFNMGINRDLRLPHKWLGYDVGREIRRNHALKIQYRPPPMWLIKLFQPDLSANTAYNEDSSPNVRRPGDPKGVRNVNSARSVSLKTRYDLGATFETLFNKMGLEVEGTREEKREQREKVLERLPPVIADSLRALDAAADSTRRATAPSDTSDAGGGGVDALVALRKLGEILSGIRRVNANVSQRVNNNYARVPGRPSLAYQFGIDPSTGVEEFDQPDRITRALNMSADTGAQLTADIDVATRVAKSFSSSEVSNHETESVSTTFPDVQMSWKGLEKIGLFGVLFNQTQANVNYKKFKQESGRKGKDPDNIRETLTLSPSLLFTWKNETKSTLGVSYNRVTTDTRGSISENTTLSINLDFRKSFRGGAGFKLPIPLFRKEVKWKSTLDTNLGLAYSRTGGERRVAGTDIAQPIAGTTSIRVSPNVAYTFSQALSGRAFVDYSRSYNEARDQTTTTVRIGVTAVFTF
jgi:cell surface protein SprA